MYDMFTGTDSEGGKEFVQNLNDRCGTDWDVVTMIAIPEGEPGQLKFVALIKKKEPQLQLDFSDPAPAETTDG